LTPLPAGV